MKRVVTYDIVEGGDYDEFYSLVRKYKAKQLTESTYEFNTMINLITFKNMVKNAFSKKDNVYLIYSSSSQGLVSIKI